ncbi:MAG TPA: DUF1080 domain-containing protein [Candidatus Paceibacterota bacterium]|nr:DUF1080 domain-containing protein [Verrucomicrobiota bacterium]HRY49941.1 DUF1080 domain-containing protein [Candidatus Paceibacterota bacterium]
MMKSFFTGIGFGLLFMFLSCGQSTCAAEPTPEKGDSLFNGKDLTGWTGVHDVSFEVQEGNLRLIKGMGWLRSDKQYQDFILELECRALEPKYDSGIFLRAGLDGQPWPKDGWQVNLRYDALGGLVKGYKPVVPAESDEVPVNQWFKLKIEVKSKTVVLHVDGVKAWEYKNIDAERGYIGIQAENKSFDFRNIRLQELKAAAP